MNIIQYKLIFSLIPLISPMLASAQSEAETVSDSALHDMKESAPMWRASQVIGINVNNSADETIGEIKDLVLNLKGGRVIAVIISSGGFLGIADTVSAVPVSVLRYDSASKSFRTKLTKEQLSKAPHFKNDAWPDYSKAEVQDALHAFRDSIGGDVNAPDNTAQNEKEMRKDGLTPIDQGSSDKDVQITKDIRSGIMAEDLSFNAKNIKIITRDEKVTLKGVVESAAEHQAILKLAGRHCDSTKLTDELKVTGK